MRSFLDACENMGVQILLSRTSHICQVVSILLIFEILLLIGLQPTEMTLFTLFARAPLALNFPFVLSGIYEMT